VHNVCCCCWYNTLKLLLFFDGPGVWTQGLELARQELYHSSHTSSPANSFLKRCTLDSWCSGQTRHLVWGWQRSFIPHPVLAECTEAAAWSIGSRRILRTSLFLCKRSNGWLALGFRERRHGSYAWCQWSVLLSYSWGAGDTGQRWEGCEQRIRDLRKMLERSGPPLWVCLSTHEDMATLVGISWIFLSTHKDVGVPAAQWQGLLGRRCKFESQFWQHRLWGLGQALHLP
jgi:hypothetical protein